jgi:hypothetical protein
MEDNDQTFAVGDLAQLKKVIEIACARGAFRADEMSAVGVAYDKLNRFLDSILTTPAGNSEPQDPANSKGEQS